MQTGIFTEIEDAIEAAYSAQKKLVQLSKEKKEELIAAMREIIIDNAAYLARLAVEESHMGRVEDKIQKNILAAKKTPGTEDLETKIIKGDSGTTIVERGPFGVIGAIAPTTNPSETIINNGIGMIAGGNTVVFSPHPSARKTSLETLRLMNEAVIKAGGPPNLLTAIENPVREKTQIMMHHPKINLIVATGGPGVVKAALSCGKKAIGAGAGNPPVVVDETADIEQAGRDIILGCSFDNNLPCISEKEVFAVAEIFEELIQVMQQNNAYLVTDQKILAQMTELLVQDGKPNKAFIGRDAKVIMQAVGVDIPDSCKAVIMVTEKDHPFVVTELLMPVLPIVKVKDFSEALELAVETEHGFRHTALIHSKNIDHLNTFSRVLPTTICVKNAPSYAGIGAGGEGHTTFTIAGPTGEGVTSARSFTREHRFVLVEK